MLQAAASETERVAKLVLADIHQRGLKPGQRYLTAQEAARLLRLRKAVVNDAMRYLAEQRILTRKRRVGTLIGPCYTDDNVAHPNWLESDTPVLDYIHVIMNDGFVQTGTAAVQDFPTILTQLLPGCIVQMHHVPDDKIDTYTKNLVNTIHADSERKQALVLVRSSRDTQILVDQTEIPAVIYGTAYPDVKRLPAIDADQYQSGRLAASFALAHGGQRFALIMRYQWRRGDNFVLNGLTQTLGKHGLSMDALKMHSILPQARVIAMEIHEMMQADRTPQVIFCRDDGYANWALQALEQWQRHHQVARQASRAPDAVPSRPMVISLQSPHEAEQPFPRVRLCVHTQQQIRQIAKVLLAQVNGEPLEQRHTTIAVELVAPDSEIKENA